jgi:hypothetical protein
MPANVTGTFYYLMMHELPWQYQLTNSSFQPASTLPSRYDSALKELIMRCIEKLPASRPEADVMFQSAFEHVNKADIILASLRTSGTTSVRNEQIRLPTPTAAITADSSTTRQSLESPDPPPRASSAPADPSLPVVNDEAAHPLEPSQASSSGVRPIRQSQALSVAAGSRSLSLLGHSSSWRQSAATESFDRQMERGLGSFVVDYRRYPPLDALPPPFDDVSSKVLLHNLTGRIAFKSSEYQDDSAQKRSRLKFFKSPPPQQTKSQVAIEAAASFEYLLQGSEDYVRAAIDNVDGLRQWILRKLDQKQDCYVVVGYITYVDARVSEDAADESLKSSVALAIPVEAGMSSSSFNTRNSGKQRFNGSDYLTEIDMTQPANSRKWGRTSKLSMCEK